MPSLASPEVQRRIGEAVAAACAALGLHHGPVHAECRVSGDSVYVLEVAARPIGGLCSSALRFRSKAPQAAGGTGAAMSLEEVLLRHALGEDVTSYVREEAASGAMMIRSRSAECTGASTASMRPGAYPVSKIFGSRRSPTRRSCRSRRERAIWDSSSRAPRHPLQLIGRCVQPTRNCISRSTAK